MDNDVNIDSAIEKFVDVARRYCAWAESAPPAAPHQDMIVARQILSELHLAAINLPLVDFDGDHESEAISHERWKEIFERFSDLPLSGYWDVFDPLKEEEKEAVFHTLADDLADIFRDVKENFSLYDAGYVNEAVWQWRFDFLIHWGKHLTGAQRALHSYFVNKEEEEC